MFKTSRRGFMVGCSVAIAGWAGGLSFTAFGNAEAEPNQEIVITIFLRGGMDGINVVPVIAGPPITARSSWARTCSTCRGFRGSYQ